jgi:trans-aconitate 2-methyltransferase
MAADSWDPAQYERFAAERAQPFWDLAALVEERPIRTAVDLGCGTGELTAALAARLGIASMVGIDSSAAMLAKAPAGLDVIEGDIGAWTSNGDHDLVFANASLHWVPDHPAVLARWWAALAPGGQLAVQVPTNADHASHRVATEVALGEPYLSAMGGAPPPDPVADNVLRPEHYAAVLYDLGAARQHVRLQVYGHVLERSADVVEWVKGTSLTRFAEAMPADVHTRFLEEYRRRLLAEIGETAPYFYPFKRILLWAAKSPSAP